MPVFPPPGRAQIRIGPVRIARRDARLGAASPPHGGRLNGGEDRGKRREAELYLAVEEIDHSRKSARSM
jgi:hypothetical protein